MSEEQKEVLDALTELRQEMEKSRKIYEEENDAWWDGLTEKEREDAFYAVIKRMHKAELVDKGSYRWALYDVFGFDQGMYARGMECGYMELHNAIVHYEEFAKQGQKNDPTN